MKIVYKPKTIDDPIAKRMLNSANVSVIVDNFHGVVWQEKTKSFPCFTVYFNPKDFPEKYVVRLFDGNKPTRLCAVKDTLEEARAAIPKQPVEYLRVVREKNDDPVIVETWL